MAELEKWREANKLFSKKSRPKKSEWCDWIASGVVRGKVLDGQPFIDLDHFIANDILEAPRQAERTGFF